MTALILAAGRGSRMLEHTLNKPKCLIELAGKPLLDWQHEALKKAGIENIYMVSGYLSDALLSKGYSCFQNPDWDQTNSLESLLCAHELLSQHETIISYGDIVYSSEVIKTLRHSFGDIITTYDLFWEKLWQKRFTNPLEDAETFRIQEGRVVEIGKKPSRINEIQGQYMGLLKLTPKGFSQLYEKVKTIKISKRKKMDITSVLQFLIESNIPIHGVPVSGKWCEADSPEDVRLYEHLLQSERDWIHDWRED